MTTQSLVTHPELTPTGVAGIAFLGALLGRALGLRLAEHHAAALAHRPADPRRTPSLG